MIDGFRFPRLTATALLVAAASAALAVAGPDALVPFKDVAGAATEVGVAFVIDFGNSTKPLVGCAEVPPSDNGYEALTAFLDQEHEAAPTYNQSGLLCSIDNVPPGAPSVCGTGVSGGYEYWSYWYMTDGSGTWTYASRGASVAVGSATAGQDVEGWRFQDPGPDNASAPPPGAAPDYAAICGSTTSAVVAPPATTVAPGHAPASPAPTTTAPTAGPAATTTPTTPPTSSATPTAPTATGADGPPTSTRPTTPDLKNQSLRATTAADSHEPGGGSDVPLVIGSLIVLALAAATLVGWRRRSGSQ